MGILHIISEIFTLIQIFFSIAFFHFRRQLVPQAMKFQFQLVQACYLGLEEPRFYYTYFDSKMLNVPPETENCIVCIYDRLITPFNPLLHYIGFLFFSLSMCHMEEWTGMEEDLNSGSSYCGCRGFQWFVRLIIILHQWSDVWLLYKAISVCGAALRK